MTYENSLKGVRALLRAEADQSLVPHCITADPYVRGAWLVRCTNAVVLLCYTDPHPFAGQFEEVVLC